MGGERERVGRTRGRVERGEEGGGKERERREREKERGRGEGRR